MEINWTIVTYLVIAYFAISGLMRGWWKEAVTTIFLTLLVFFLQNPDSARATISLVNDVLAAVWSYIPTSITPVVNDGLETVFAVRTSGSNAYQIDPTDPGTWLVILAILVGVSTLVGRSSLGLQPTLLGKFFGGLVGGLNGFLIVSLFREYLDGRALPGSQTAPSELVLAGSSAFGPAANGFTIQATNLPNFTILDSIFPWIAIGVGLFFVVSVLKTRLQVAASNDGRKIAPRVPPFYKTPGGAPQKSPAQVLSEVFRI